MLKDHPLYLTYGIIVLPTKGNINDQDLLDFLNIKAPDTIPYEYEEIINRLGLSSQELVFSTYSDYFNIEQEYVIQGLKLPMIKAFRQ